MNWPWKTRKPGDPDDIGGGFPPVTVTLKEAVDARPGYGRPGYATGGFVGRHDGLKPGEIPAILKTDYPMRKDAVDKFRTKPTAMAKLSREDFEAVCDFAAKELKREIAKRDNKPLPSAYDVAVKVNEMSGAWSTKPNERDIANAALVLSAIARITTSAP